LTGRSTWDSLDVNVELGTIPDAYWPPAGKRSGALETPHLLIDGAKMDRNIEKMAGIARERGVKLRPHVKTHKIPMIARRQLESGSAGITAAKVSEAEVMPDGGIREYREQKTLCLCRTSKPVQLSAITDRTLVMSL
jgi:predicted amino acid racemase